MFVNPVATAKDKIEFDKTFIIFLINFYNIFVSFKKPKKSLL